MSLTGKILMTCDLARRYGIKDIDGEQMSESMLRETITGCYLPTYNLCFSPGRDVADYTSIKFLMSQSSYLSWLAPLVPSFIRLPRFVLTLANSRF